MKQKAPNIPVGQMIAKRRKAKGLTQEVMAELLDVTVEAISRMERGTIMPSLKRLQQFADIFECTSADLLTQSSRRVDDQTAYIGDLLATLDESDRALLVEMVEKFSKRLSKTK